MKKHDDILTPQEVGEYLKISDKIIYYLTAKKRIPCFKVGRRLRFRKTAIDKWIEEQEGAKKK